MKKSIEEMDAYFTGSMNTVESIEEALEEHFAENESIKKEIIISVLERFKENIVAYKMSEMIAGMKNED